jgi:UDP-glucose:(heptosyl)LPS alpha-1,3-glucosyltransferase
MRTRTDDGIQQSHTNRGIADTVRLTCEKRNYLQRRYRRVIAVADGIMRELRDCYGVPEEDVTVIPNGVDLNAFKPPSGPGEVAALRHRAGLREDDAVILWVGNEFHRKGLKATLDAIAAVKHDRLRLLVAGKDNPEPYRRYSDTIGIGEQVMFAGSVANMPDLYRAADIFLLPSAYEACSLALLEAAASGLPILTTRINGAEELLRDGESAIFVKSNAGEIARALRITLESSELRGRLGKAARESSLRYSWDNVTAQTLRVYEKVLMEKKRSPHA